MSDVIAQEGLRVIKGTAVLDGVTLLVAICLGRFTLPILLGLLVGSCYAVLNFFLIGLAVERALQRSPRSARLFMVGQYFLRMFLTAVVIILGLKASCLHAVTVILPLFYPKLVVVASAVLAQLSHKCLEKGG